MNNKQGSIAFINPPGPAKLYRSMVCTFISKANYIWVPQDFINLSAHIPDDRDLKFYDCCINGIGEEELFNKLKTSPPDVSIVSISSVVFEKDLAFLKNIANCFPGMRLLVLGDVLLEEKLWEKVFIYADGLLLNSIDVDLNNYIKNGISSSPNLILKGQHLLHEPKETNHSAPHKVALGIPRHELFLDRRYRFPFSKSYLYSTVSTQFGCLYKCNYCPWSQISVTYRGYEEVLEELVKLRSLGVRDLFFGDPSFGIPKENAVKLLESMIAKKLGMRWVCYIHPNQNNSDFLRLMKKAGCHTVIIGIDDEDLPMLKEKYDRTLTESRLLKFCEDCSQLNLRMCGDFIIGLNTDEVAVQRIVEFAIKLNIDYVSVNILTVLFGSVIRDNLVREGKVDPLTFGIGFDTSGTFGNGKNDLLRLRNLAVRKFYLRPSYLLRRFTQIGSFEEFKIQLEEMMALIRNTA